jgi:Rrf2 family nitric oxide-sensitive transcriptional repressor
MRLTTFTDYCLRTLIYVALKGDELATIDEIAERYAINRNHLVKVVHRLGQLGYLHTMRGKGGGVQLAEDPAKINLGTLVRETEDDLALVECFQDRTCLCVIAPACVLRKALHQALDAFLKTLDGYTIADLLKPSRSLARLLALPQGEARHE